MKIIGSRSILIISALLALSSCSTNETYVPDNLFPDATAATRISGGIPDTRTITDDAFNTTWSSEDCIGVFSPESYCGWYIYEGGTLLYQKDKAVNMNFKVSEGGGSSKASFAISESHILFNGNFAWNANAANGIHNFYAYSPFRTGFGALMPLKAIPFTLPASQTQQGAGNKAHIGNMDFMYASLQLNKPDTAADKDIIDEELNFSFIHAFALMEFTISNPTTASMTVEKVIFETQGADIAGDFTFDLTDGSRMAGKKINESGQITAGATQQSITLLTKNSDNTDGMTIAAGKEAKVYMVVNPVQLNNALVKVVTTDNKGQTFTGSVNITAGKYYKKNLELNALQPLAEHTVIDFEDVTLNSDGILQETTLIGEDDYELGNFYGYTSSGLTIRTYIDAGGSSTFWCGFTFSAKTDMATEGLSNQYSVYNTAGHSGNKFILGYDGASFYGPDYSTRILIDKGKIVDHLYITNSTYAALSMKKGDGFAKKHSYTDRDWFKVTITGYLGDKITGSVDVYRSDFRTTSSPGVVETWQKADLTALGTVTRIDFNCSGSDSGTYGLNTPSYFCIDDIAIQK